MQGVVNCIYKSKIKSITSDTMILYCIRYRHIRAPSKQSLNEVFKYILDDHQPGKLERDLPRVITGKRLDYLAFKTSQSGDSIVCC